MSDFKQNPKAAERQVVGLQRPPVSRWQMSELQQHRNLNNSSVWLTSLRFKGLQTASWSSDDAAHTQAHLQCKDKQMGGARDQTSPPGWWTAALSNEVLCRHHIQLCLFYIQIFLIKNKNGLTVTNISLRMIQRRGETESDVTQPSVTLWSIIGVKLCVRSVCLDTQIVKYWWIVKVDEDPNADNNLRWKDGKLTTLFKQKEKPGWITRN